MKKMISLLLAVVMICSLATVALAAEEGEAPRYAASESTSFGITKTYASDEDWVPGEVLSFDIDAVDGNPGTEMLTIGTENKYTVSGLSNTITVTVPSYAAAGVYNYTIKEIAGTTAGVTAYDTDKTIYVTVLVEYDNENDKLVIGNPTDPTEPGIVYFIKKTNNEKVSEFENVFETYDFSVAKNVTGNMANQSDAFDITVTLTLEEGTEILTPIQVGGVEVPASAWEDGVYTTTLTLSMDDGKTTFADIPAGVTVEVEETETDMQGYTYVSTTNDGVVNAASEVKDIVVLNRKEMAVDTGIALDSMPYILILAFAACGLVLFTTRKRVQE